MTDLPPLDPAADVLTLTRALVDAPSVSGGEGALADAVEAALRALWARRPGISSTARRVPWQPPSISPSVGSRRIARSP